MDGGCNNLSFGRLFGSVTAFTKTSQISKKSSIISVIAEFLQNIIEFEEV